MCVWHLYKIKKNKAKVFRLYCSVVIVFLSDRLVASPTLSAHLAHLFTYNVVSFKDIMRDVTRPTPDANPAPDSRLSEW